MHCANIARQCSGGKDIWCTEYSAEHSPPVSRGLGARPKGLASRRRPRAGFSLVPSTARSLFDGSKRECGVGTVGFESCHALADSGQYAPSTRNIYLLYALFLLVGPCGAVLSIAGKYPKRSKRGVSNPPSCISPQRLLKRRRAVCSVHLGTQ